MMRTACPAVNALIQAKVVEARQRGAELKLSIAAKWDDPLMPAWGNLPRAGQPDRQRAGCGDERPTARGRKADGRAGFGRGFAQLVLSPCATTGRPSRKSSAPQSSSRVSPPNGRGRVWVFFIVNQTVTELGGRLTVDSRDRGHGVLRLCAAQAIEAGRRRNGAVGRKYRYL